ncbi:MAG: hypothetical protein ACJ8F3_04580 [Xanthobacteraceae bacterium]
MRGGLRAAVVALWLGSPAHAAPLQIEGTAGYLSEWEFSGAASTGSESSEFTGGLMWKHVGLCSANGPQEKPGEVQLRIERSGAIASVTAVLSFEGSSCTFKGGFSADMNGFMDCPHAKAVPLSMSIR